jgi:hypothetical protein
LTLTAVGSAGEEIVARADFVVGPDGRFVEAGSPSLGGDSVTETGSDGTVTVTSVGGGDELAATGIGRSAGLMGVGSAAALMVLGGVLMVLRRRFAWDTI